MEQVKMPSFTDGLKTMSKGARQLGTAMTGRLSALRRKELSEQEQLLKVQTSLKSAAAAKRARKLQDSLFAAQAYEFTQERLATPLTHLLAVGKGMLLGFLGVPIKDVESDVQAPESDEQAPEDDEQPGAEG